MLAVHIDNGLMRKNESKMVIEALKNIGLDVKRRFNEEIMFPDWLITSHVT